MRGPARPTRLVPVLLLVLHLGLAAALGACGDPDPEKAAGELASMKAEVDAELRAMAAVLVDGGLGVERATGHVESEGMPPHLTEDYSASAVVVGEGDEADQVARARSTLEAAGWTLETDGVDHSEPYVQLERDDFRTTIGWTRLGERELVLTLDQAGDVEVPTDTDPVERGNSEDIPLD